MNEIREMCKDDTSWTVEDGLSGMSDLDLAESMAQEDFDEWKASEWQANVEDYGYIKNAVRDLRFWQMNIGDDWDDELPEELMAEVSELREALFETVDAMKHEVFDASVPPLPLIKPSAGYLAGTDHPMIREQPKTGRNDPCPCGSGKKYKKCCGGQC